MPTYRIQINAKPEDVFAYVSDLTRHGEWTVNPVQIEAVNTGPVAVGSRYKSVARTMGTRIQAELQVTEHLPPSRFTFVAKDRAGTFTHLFTFQPKDGGTLAERKINGKFSLIAILMLPIVFIPASMANSQAMKKLKARLEKKSS